MLAWYGMDVCWQDGGLLLRGDALRFIRLLEWNVKGAFLVPAIARFALNKDDFYYMYSCRRDIDTKAYRSVAGSTSDGGLALLPPKQLNVGRPCRTSPYLTR